MTRRLLLATLLVSLLFNVGFIIGRVQMRQATEPAEARADTVELVARKLELTPEQRSQFAELRRNFADDWQDLQAQAALVREELGEQLAGDSPDMERIEQLLTQGMDVDQQLRIAAAERFREFAAELTPEQRERLGRMMQRHRPPPFNGHDPQERLQRFDVNRDGVIDEDEKAQAKRYFEQSRRDWGERRRGDDDWRRAEDRPFDPQREQFLREVLLRRVDANDDGRIDDAELRALLDWLNAPPPPGHADEAQPLPRQPGHPPPPDHG